MSALPLAVVCPPGLEAVARNELKQLGVSPKLPAPQDRESGIIECEASLEKAYELNLQLRTASRVLIRLGSFNAAAFSELHKKAARLPWREYLKPGQKMVVRVATHGSRLYHKKGIAERVMKAASDAMGSEVKAGQVVDDEPEEGSALVVVRLVRDFCTVSMDSSGEHLHRRGYRLDVAKAPIRENLAAAMLMLSGWPGNVPLVDPFCGSGTLAIEAALMAKGIPPGWKRSFAFQTWPGFSVDAWQKIREQAAASMRAGMPAIAGFDRDAGAIAAAAKNAERAGVSELIEWSCRSISDLSLPGQPGWIVTNPPYGERVKGGPDMRNLYARMGSVWRRQASLWKIYFLSASPRLTGQLGMACRPVAVFKNGGLLVKLMEASIRPEGSTI